MYILACVYHVSHMKHACQLSVIPATCAVHATLILTCIQHAFCPYCNMHVVLSYATHEYNIHVTGMHVWVNMHVSASNIKISYRVVQKGAILAD